MGWGTHVNPWLIHVNVWQKPLQYCKVISFQLTKINGKKKERLKPCSVVINLSALECGGEGALMSVGTWYHHPSVK